MEYQCEDKINDERDFEYDHGKFTHKELYEHPGLTFEGMDDTKGAARSRNIANIVKSN